MNNSNVDNNVERASGLNLADTLVRPPWRILTLFVWKNNTTHVSTSKVSKICVFHFWSFIPWRDTASWQFLLVFRLPAAALGQYNYYMDTKRLRIEVSNMMNNNSMDELIKTRDKVGALKAFNLFICRARHALDFGCQVHAQNVCVPDWARMLCNSLCEKWWTGDVEEPRIWMNRFPLTTIVFV